LFNGGSAIAQGLEAQGTFQLLEGKSTCIRLPLTMSYTLTRAVFTHSFESEFDAWEEVIQGDHLPYVPSHQWSTSIGFEHPKYLIDLSARYSSEMLTQAGRFDDTSVSRTDDAFTIDIAINYKLSRELSAFANVNNAFNNIYVVSRRPAGVRPNQPRTVNLGLKANF